MMTISTSSSDQPPTLLLIDFQRGFLDPEPWGGERSTPQAEDNARALLSAWRAANGPILHVRHASREPGSPLAPDSAGFAPLDGLEERDGEAVIVKSVNSAFIGTDLEAMLRGAGATDLVVAGLTTDHCVSTSVRMVANLGFAVTLVADSCAAFAKTDVAGEIPADVIHRVHLASLSSEFARVIDTREALTLARDGAPR